MMIRQQARARASEIHSQYQATRRGSTTSTMSTRMCWPRRNIHGATSMVMRYSMLSESSFDQASPRRPGMSGTLRSSTSPQIISIIRNSTAQASNASASSNLPYKEESFSMNPEMALPRGERGTVCDFYKKIHVIARSKATKQSRRVAAGGTIATGLLRCARNDAQPDACAYLLSAFFSFSPYSGLALMAPAQPTS